jgi:hypothetical protein
MPNWIKDLLSGSRRAVAFYVTLYLVLPIGVPLMTGWAGYLQGLPWMYIMVGSGVMFAAMSTGLLRIAEYTDRDRVNGKLHFHSVRLGHNPLKPSEIIIGVMWVNQARVPIEFHVDHVGTRIGDRVPASTVYAQRTVTVPPGGLGWYDDHAINVATPPAPGTIEGFVEFKIRYGRTGNPSHGLVTRKNVVVAFNEAGSLLGGSATEAPTA